MIFEKWLYYNMVKPIESTILCIRFPFLYPRNRWTNTHYTNWSILNKRRNIFKNYHVLVSEEDAYKNKQGYYFKKVTEGGWAEYWTNWWALPYVKLIDLYHDYVLAFFHCIPSHTELDALDDGWRNAFGIKMCKEIRKQLIKDRRLFSFRIIQLKEKWGCMQLYSNGGSEAVYKIIDKYSDISSTTCINCGKEADVITSPYGWMLPYCKECYEKYDSRSTIYKQKVNGQWKNNEDLEETE
jgi:hypothetical protein